MLIKAMHPRRLLFTFRAPNMTKLLLEIGQDLVQESTYFDIAHARNLPEMPKNMDTYKQLKKSSAAHPPQPGGGVHFRLDWLPNTISVRSCSTFSPDDVAALQKQVRKLESQLEEVREDTENEKKQKIGLQSKVRQLEQGLAGVVEQQDEQGAELNNAIAQLEEQRGLNNEMHEVRKQLDDMGQIKKTLQVELNEVETKVKQMQAQLKEMRLRLLWDIVKGQTEVRWANGNGQNGGATGSRSSSLPV